MKNTWTYTLAWLAAVGAALVMALAAPNEAKVMGRMPSFMARTLSHQAVAIPEDLPAERTLALITFRGASQAQVDGWVHGLKLGSDSTIAWMRMPVLNDPGNSAGRSAIETKLLRKYPAESERARLVPVFTDRDQFVRSAGLSGTDHVYAVVVNRQGDVLARAEGAFDAGKAGNLRETLLHQGY
jgi:hypothetical protein